MQKPIKEILLTSLINATIVVLFLVLVINIASIVTHWILPEIPKLSHGLNLSISLGIATLALVGLSILGVYMGAWTHDERDELKILVLSTVVK